MSTLEEIQAKREAARKQIADKYAERKAQDLAAISELEVQHGATNIAVVEVPFSAEDLPVCVAVRTPKPAEVSRYRDRVKAEDADTARAAIELAESCLVYPDAETFARQVKARPGMRLPVPRSRRCPGSGNRRASRSRAQPRRPPHRGGRGRPRRQSGSR